MTPPCIEQQSNFVNKLHIYQETRCNRVDECYFLCKVQLLETITTMIPVAFGLHFQLMQASFVVNFSLSTSSLFQAVPVMHCSCDLDV